MFESMFSLVWISKKYQSAKQYGIPRPIGGQIFVEQKKVSQCLTFALANYSISFIMLMTELLKMNSILQLPSCDAECLFCCVIKSLYAACHNAECRYTECRQAKCRGALVRARCSKPFPLVIYAFSFTLANCLVSVVSQLHSGKTRIS
jgi:hypothetical protein